MLSENSFGYPCFSFNNNLFGDFFISTLQAQDAINYSSAHSRHDNNQIYFDQT